MSYDVFVQGIGLVASALVILSFLQKSDQWFKILVGAGAVVFGVHFFLLTAYSGAFVAFINAMRTFTSMRFHNSNKLLYFFLSLYLLAAFVTYEDAIDLLPIISGSIGTIALFKLSGLPLRVAFVFNEIGWLSYAVIVQSIGGMINNSFTLCANLITMYRLLKDKKNG